MELISKIKKALSDASQGKWLAQKGAGWFVKLGDTDKIAIVERPAVVGMKLEEADAHLIANAPEWLNSLIELVEKLQVNAAKDYNEWAKVASNYAEESEFKDTLIESQRSLIHLAINQWEFMDAEDDPVNVIEKVMETLKEAKALPFYQKGTTHEPT